MRLSARFALAIALFGMALQGFAEYTPESAEEGTSQYDK